MRKSRLTAVAIMALVLAALVSAQAPGGKDKRAGGVSDQERFVGEWRVVKGVEKGKEMSADLATMLFTFTRDGKLIVAGKQTDGLTFKILGAGKIDLILESGKKTVLIGIYKFDGNDRLTMCFGKEGGTRPTEFGSEAESDTVLFVLTRAKLEEDEARLQAVVAKLGGEFRRAAFSKAKDLVWLVDLHGTKTTDADLALLKPVPGSFEMDLSFTHVTDKCIASLAGFDVISVNLMGTKVGNAVIEDLRKMPKLHTVNVAQTAVTANGIAELVKDRTCNVCVAALGDKARFRVFQDFADGKLKYNYLMINDTYYGRYYPAPEEWRRLATTYYHRDGPVGQVMSKLEWFPPAGLFDYPSDARMPASLMGTLSAGMMSGSGPLPVSILAGLWSEPAIAVVRLNVGTDAAYCRPFQHIDFYNSSPELQEFSLPRRGRPVFFGFIKEAKERGCAVHVIEGAERVSLARKAPRNFYSAVFLDITRNDLRDINTDLLTKEALADMMSSLTETGVLCFHTSHRYHDMVPPIVDAAASLNLSWKVGKDGYSEASHPAHFSSEWVMVARKMEYMTHLANVAKQGRNLDWHVPPSTGKHLWRDGQVHDLDPLARTK